VARGQEPRLHVEQERVAHWLAQGARPSERVSALLKEAQKAAS
jgi:small subunit ribosomal protein S16